MARGCGLTWLVYMTSGATPARRRWHIDQCPVQPTSICPASERAGASVDALKYFRFVPTHADDARLFPGPPVIIECILVRDDVTHTQRIRLGRRPPV